MLSLRERLQLDRLLYGSDEYRFTKSLQCIRRQALYDKPYERKITVPFERLYQMIQSYIINDQISYNSAIPCVPGKEYEYSFIHYNHIYGRYNKYTIPEHLLYEMTSTNFRELISLMDSHYGDGEGETFTYYLYTNEHLKILDTELSISIIKYAINKRVNNYNGKNLSIIDFFDYYIRQLLEMVEIDELKFLESIFGEKAKYILNRYNARCKIHYEHGYYMWSDSLCETISITYNGINLDVVI